MAGRLAGRLALITGAGAGLGTQMARRFHEEGGEIVVNDLRTDAAEAVAKQVGGTAAYGPPSLRSRTGVLTSGVLGPRLRLAGSTADPHSAAKKPQRFPQLSSSSSGFESRPPRQIPLVSEGFADRESPWIHTGSTLRVRGRRLLGRITSTSARSPSFAYRSVERLSAWRSMRWIICSEDPWASQAVALECFVPSYIRTHTPTFSAARFHSSLHSYRLRPGRPADARLAALRRLRGPEGRSGG